MSTFMTQRAMMGSPLFMGGNLPDNDELTDSILLNPHMIECDQNGVVGHPVTHRGDLHIFRTMGKGDGEGYGWIGIFNRGESQLKAEVTLADMGLNPSKTYGFFDVWNKTTREDIGESVEVSLSAHDVLFMKYQRKE